MGFASWVLLIGLESVVLGVIWRNCSRKKETFWFFFENLREFGYVDDDDVSIDSHQNPEVADGWKEIEEGFWEARGYMALVFIWIFCVTLSLPTELRRSGIGKFTRRYKF
ncbi:hypothetical protein E3N88_02173 [Mikania micrantha]|uniref:Uncharacterized protein n=1 Tax=Mikania micrantha TaxID=192012 RepID=A0A5N6Q5B1_9ASTR|nr:hypothetical protein E3N88_02173 [Mikania micrantha]